VNKTNADLAVEARYWGRYITGHLYRDLLAWPPAPISVDMQNRIIAGDRQAWVWHIDPSGGYPR
jgi:hypothetical protein